jgi:hypothetical protein
MIILLELIDGFFAISASGTKVLFHFIVIVLHLHPLTGGYRYSPLGGEWKRFVLLTKR